MSFMFLKVDPFLSQLQNKTDKDRKGLLIDTERPIRRPYRGVQIKEDTYSTISVLSPTGKAINLISSSEVKGKTDSDGRTGKVQEYSDYIIQSIDDQRSEKQQIVETFGDSFIYFFGERPRVINVQGLLLNTEDFNWRSQFWKNYDENLRGTKLVQRNARVYLSYDTIIIEGYILNASASENSESPYTVPFGFSMLATGYYDWSDIGQTRFPGYGEAMKDLKSVDALNLELEERRSQFSSTAAQVRLKNLTPATGVAAAIRGTIRGANLVVSSASNLIDKVHNVIGGRTVRVPIGIAGYLQATGAAQIGVGAFGSSRILSSEGLGMQYDSATGTLKGVRGSVKLRMPGNSMFAPSWESPITNSARGYIHENLDEYAVRKQPALLAQLLTTTQYVELMNRKSTRKYAAEDNQIKLAMHNQMAEAGGILGDLADAVKFVKSAFGMVMTAASFARDPLAGLKASLGISEIGSNVSKSRIEGRKESLEKQGIKSAYEDKDFLEGVGNFIGGSALRTFKAAAGLN